MLDFEILSICLIISSMVYGRPIHEITETRDTPETQIPAGFSELKNDDLKPSEIQKAVCTVTSGDVRATAEAFTTRTLKGVCGSMEMLKAFSDLENNLRLQLQHVQKSVQDLHYLIVRHKTIETYVVNETYDDAPVTSASSNNPVTTPAPFKFQAIQVENKQLKSIELKSLSTSKDVGGIKTKTVRENNISKNNNTFIGNKNVKVYTYYWRIENFSQSIKSAKSLSRESPIFSIRGKALKIKAHFQHLHRDYLYLQLEDYSASPQLSSGNSIILDTGSIFKEISTDNLKYKMSILDQSKKRSSDLVSQEFDNYETGFSIPNSALMDSPFIKDDSLLIQLFLYL